jgi:hypothetical protein
VQPTALPVARLTTTDPGIAAERRAVVRRRPIFDSACETRRGSLDIKTIAIQLLHQILIRDHPP